MEAPSKQVWFFDDDEKNAPHPENAMIHFVQLNRSGPPKQYGKVSQYFYDKRPDSKFTQTSMDTDYMDPISGVQEPQMRDLRMAAMRGKVLAAVFDWDRTLTMFEGIFMPVSPTTSSIDEYKKGLATKYSSMSGIEDFSDKELSHYMFHNPAHGASAEDVAKRPKALGALLRDIQSLGIPIYVLTNNSAALVSPGRDQRGLLADFLNQIGVTLPEDHILYNYARNKEKMIMDVIIPQVLASNSASGGRKRSVRKNRKSRGTTRSNKTKKRTHKKKQTHKKKKHNKRKKTTKKV